MIERAADRAGEKEREREEAELSGEGDKEVRH